MPCTSCGDSGHKGTIRNSKTDDAAGNLCIDCFDEFRDLDRRAKGCAFGDCPAEFYVRRGPPESDRRRPRPSPRIPIFRGTHLRELGV